MKREILAFWGLAFLLVSACTLFESPGTRAARVAEACLKIIRYEHLAMAGKAELAGKAAEADRLFTAVLKLDPHCVAEYVESGKGGCAGQVGEFAGTAGKLENPAAEDDPAAVVQSVLRQAPEFDEAAEPLLAGYAAAVQLCLEVERDGTLMQDLLPFLVSLGCPLTLKDLGLADVPRSRLEELAAQASKATGGMPYATGPFEYFITFIKLNNWGSKFSGQVTADTLAAQLMADPACRILLTGLRRLPPKTVGFLGDSHMDGIHWATQAPFPDIVAAVLKQVNPRVKVVNAGKGGDDSGEALERMDADLVAHRPDISFVMLGGNDSRWWNDERPKVTAEEYFANLSGIVNRLRAVGGEVVILSYPLSQERSGRELETFLSLREQMRRVRETLATGWIDLAGTLDRREPESVFAVDMIHFNPETHKWIALKVLEYLAVE
ncbi:MAG: GDSL-type esterase/lipase family protein [Candidatus Glassbacteria bacterium]